MASEGIMLDEIGHTEKGKYRIVCLYVKSKEGENQIHRNRS